MKLKTVTFTGLDDQVNLGDVVALSRQYPFIEWGVLLSLNRQSKESRYPSYETLEKISNQDFRKSAHICGSLQRQAMDGEHEPFEEAIHLLVRGAKRLQINTGKPIAQLWSKAYLMSLRAQQYGIEIIMQCSSFSDSDLDTDLVGVSFLHDASGGKGISGNFQYPVTGGYVGFAGGINPGNILAKLEQVAALRCANDFWIDMESGIRNDDDELDLEKVAKVCSLVEPFVKRDAV